MVCGSIDKTAKERKEDPALHGSRKNSGDLGEVTAEGSRELVRSISV